MLSRTCFLCLLLTVPFLSHAQPILDTTDRITATIDIQDKIFSAAALPGPLQIREHLGIATFSWVNGTIIHHARNRKGGLYETRATVTPKGDYLLMFPDGGHYGGSPVKTNDMLAYRSKERTNLERAAAFPGERARGSL